MGYKAVFFHTFYEQAVPVSHAGVQLAQPGHAGNLYSNMPPPIIQ